MYPIGQSFLAAYQDCLQQKSIGSYGLRLADVIWLVLTLYVIFFVCPLLR